MAWSQTDIARLKKAIATGARRVVFGSGETRREQEFHSLKDMLDLLSRMESDVAGAQAPQRFAVTEFIRD
jgi:hypothetical protein